MRARAVFGGLLLAAGCVHRPPAINGVPGAPRQPNEYWTPSAADAARLESARAERAAVPAPAMPAAFGRLGVPEIVDLALRNNPATRLSWAQARAAADVFGASRGAFLPTVSVDVNTSTARPLAPSGVLSQRSQLAPSVGLSYLVLDFGARAGNVDVARQTAIAADLSHNVVVQNTILGVEQALFAYQAARTQRDAQRSAVEEATASLNAAEERHRVGLATIADVLQARTARSQAQLTLESLEGAAHIAQGTLAVAMGIPANASFEPPMLTDSLCPDSLRFIALSVDTLIATATRNRPDLEAVRAQAAAAAAQVRVARSGLFPTVSLNANRGYTTSNVPGLQGSTYTIGLGFDLPLFTGMSRQYSLQAASEQLAAANARSEQARQQIALQVFTAYYTLQTSTDRVRTAADLLASATESESVARGRYREGVGSIVDLLIAQSALADARAQDAQARWQWRGAMAQLAHDVGVLGLRGEALAPLGTADTSGTHR
ncbi:MAG TPA: TolC family protein [Gemmatimonadaceae bacterium]|nr:TolC family protein [Gemmatimonadaceae bacterium]